MGLADTVAAELDKMQATTGLYAEHLPTGAAVAIRHTVPMNALSVIKIPIMVLAFRDADAGKLDLAARHTLSMDDFRRYVVVCFPGCGRHLSDSL